MLKINDLTFSYSRKKPPVLEHFNLELEPGGIYGLLGRNGAGKSTLLYLICGLLTPKSGEVTYKGVNTRKRRVATLNDMFIVPEEFSFPSISLRQYVNINSRFYPKFSQSDLETHLAKFDMPHDINLGSLSMGQKKKAYMCFALACNTSLLLMDEPTNGLDIPGKNSFRSFIASVINEERTIVISTHQVRDIDSILDHVIIMDNRGALLNESVASIAQRLLFTTTDSPAVASNALYSMASLGGYSVILPNDGSRETDINLETLFELALSHPDVLSGIFNKERV
ncbi:MAG: ABC transporter ATP-binding protein [Muribaculum sp.]|nr:ABC transporter ATP-binding protein [Muribaculum sp.]